MPISIVVFVQFHELQAVNTFHRFLKVPRSYAVHLSAIVDFLRRGLRYRIDVSREKVISSLSHSNMAERAPEKGRGGGKEGSWEGNKEARR